MANSGTYNHTKIHFAEGSAPATPDTGEWVIYAKTTGVFVKDDAGVEYGPFGSGDAAAHIADASDAHDASAISVLDTAANFTGTDVEAVLAELQDNIDAGGGGGGVTVLGKTTTGASVETMGDSKIYCKKVTVSGPGTFISVVARVKAPGAGNVLQMHAAIYADNAGVVGQLIGLCAPQAMYLQTDAGGTIPAHTIAYAIGARAAAAGDYWIAVRYPQNNSAPQLYYDTGGE